MGRPLAVPLLAFILGLALAGNYGYFFPPVLLVSLLAATLLSVFLRCRQPFWILLSLSLFVSGDLLLEQTVNPDLPPGHIARCQSEEPVIVEGVIDSRPEATERGGGSPSAARKCTGRNGAAGSPADCCLPSGRGGRPG